MNNTTKKAGMRKIPARPLPEALTELLGRVIAYRPDLARLCGSINAGVMLSQALYWSEYTEDADGWFYKSAGEWKHETGLSYEQQEGARKKLREFAFWTEKRKDVCGTMHYRVDYEELTRELNQLKQNPGTRSGKTPEPDSAKALNQTSGNAHGTSGKTPGPYKEAEITQESKQRIEEPIPPTPLKRGEETQQFKSEKRSLLEAFALQLKDSMLTASFSSANLDPDEYDRHFRDSWFTDIVGSVVFVDGLNRVATAKGIHKYERRLKAIFKKISGKDVEFRLTDFG